MTRAVLTGRTGRGGDGVTVVAVVVLAVLVVSGLAGRFGVFGDPAELGERLAAPSLRAPLGTDDLGRSMLPRVAEAIGNTLLLALVAVALATVGATLLAVAAGYLKGTVDRVVVALADVLFSFPGLLFAILVAAVLGPGRPAAVAAIVLVTLPLMVRVFRQAAMAVAERDFVVSAEISGVPAWRIMAVHVVPNIAGPIVVQATFAVSVAMLVESALSFLGLGVQPPAASLGSLVSGGLNALSIAPWLVFVPGAVLVAAITATNLVGDGLRDRLDPREVRALR
ncbi:ABC transporter permease [Jiangella ureilytica]|uniref:ABC transporter permease n=1 Tax=Jiangella ureilytica TaxID=2530374 RepID=A0A4R4RT80_9ACTN|nr:ABC transporter permease [Jiangella ureilytica]TDC53248.1 ABC transporter permease [Jiangella ureilytica]